jgi:hypothetical protein
MIFHPDQLTAPMPAPAAIVPDRIRACLVSGCTCKDARIVSHRRAGFFAALARRTGETADRIIGVDPDWALPLAEPIDFINA